ncbi:anti-virulence regulator CigR family protein [Nitrosomonas sp. HPC101]|uniref:anti-virulence regulator CigR family protein n=1 Tax=Nitrosomonas sp. HPC101 TaxID=1658667 RepID=UPI0019610918|nr:anti-virulence regulator CigR family protein [Nitrosomonas sp. HPC101]
MSARIVLAASLIAACSLVLSAQAAPPEGKGPGSHASNPDKKDNSGKSNSHAAGNSGKKNLGKGNSGPGNADKGRPDMSGNYDKRSHSSRGGDYASDRRYYDRGRYDDRSRYYDRGHYDSDHRYDDQDDDDSDRHYDDRGRYYDRGHYDSDHRYDDQDDQDDQGDDDSDRHYDDRGRYYDYFDDHRDRYGHLRGDDLFGDLVYAGITAALAREYALDFGLGGYSTLPPGIRKNLARGKPLPPGIARKMAPGPMVSRLPRYPGYEWRVVGTDLILISVATAVVADILYDVFD